MIDVQFRKFETANLKNPILIEGFPGIGLVGTIATGYIIKKLKMKLIGYIYCNRFPAVVSIHDYEPMPPARIYSHEGNDLLVVISEFVMPSITVPYVAEGLIEYAEKKNVRLVVSLGSLAKEQTIQQDKIYAIANTKKHRALLSKIDGIKQIKEGATSGVTAVMLSESVRFNLPVISLLAPSTKPDLDLPAAINVLKALKKITGIEINLDELESDAIKVEESIKNIIENAKEAHINYKKADTSGALIDGHNDSMYG